MTADQLKNSILQEAISGRLVPQDPNEEPAAIVSTVPEDEIPSEIPASWRWIRMKDCAAIIGGYAFPSASIKGEKGVRVIRISDISEKGFVNKSVVRYNGHENLNKFKIIPQDILIAMTGGTVGKSLFVQQMEEDMLLNQRVAIIRNNGQYAPYIDIVVKSPHIKSFINDKKNSTNDNISMGDINSFLVPLPPLAEQKRIVAKLEELLPVVEQYGKAQKELDELNAALPARLRQSVLQQAFSGELTHADISDWKDEILGNVVDILYGYPFQANMFNDDGNGKPIIRIRNIVPSKTHTYSTETCDEKYLITKGDMLVGMDGNFNVRFWNGDNAYLNQRVCRITAHSDMLLQKYLYYYLPVYLQELEENVSRTTVGHLSDKHLKKMPIPLPPIEEQKRIVAKIEELFEQINRLSEAK